MATTAEGIEVRDLPSEVKGLGRPDAVYPAKSFVGTAAGMALLAGGVLLMMCGGAAIFAYLNVPFPNDGPPAEIVLGVGVFAMVLALGIVAAALRRPGDQGDPNGFRGFLVYPTALVRAKDGQCIIFPWNQVEALVNPEQALGDYQVRSSDGRKIRIDRAVEGYRDLLGEILNHVKRERLERARSQIASGQPVTFGPFGVSRDAVQYKGKKLAWNEISVFEVVLQQGHRRLRIKRRGALWPWCYALLYGLPNEAIFFTLIEEVRTARFSKWS